MQIELLNQSIFMYHGVANCDMSVYYVRKQGK